MMHTFSVGIISVYSFQCLFRQKLYYELLQTREKYTLLKYTISKLKIISDLYFRMFNTNILNYQIYKK